MNDYRVVQKVLHWLMALIIMVDLVAAQKFGTSLPLAERLESRSDHATIGLVVLVLLLLRLYLRWRHGAPPLPASMPMWQVRAAQVTHFLLYALIGSLVLTGILAGINSTLPLVLFESWDITIGNSDREWFRTLRGFHEFVTKAIIAFIALHIVAALYHAVVSRDGVMRRMVVFWRRLP